LKKKKDQPKLAVLDVLYDEFEAHERAVEDDFDTRGHLGLLAHYANHSQDKLVGNHNKH
jgi:hypothetical protein